MTPTKKQLFWKAHLDALEAFEGTAAEYARLHGLDAKKLYVYKSWWRDHCGQAEQTGFVRVAAPSVAPPGAPGAQVLLPNGVRLALPDINAPGLLERLSRL